MKRSISAVLGLTLRVLPIGIAALAAQTEAVRADETLRISVASVDGEDLDPMKFKSAGQHTFYPLVFDPLIAKDPSTGELAPGLATSWTVSDDGTTWTIEVRDGVTFHDGSPLTAEDVKFSLDRYTGAFGTVSAPGSERLAGLISDIKVIDEDTLEITTPDGAPSLPFDMAPEAGSASAYVVPKAYVERVGDEEFNKAPIGTGPFRFKSQETGRSMTFETYPDYWGQAADYDSLQLRIVPDLSARTAQLRSGDADIVAGIVGPAIPMMKADDAVDLIAADSGHLVYMVIGGITNPDSPLHDSDVRKAISLAIDRQAIVDGLLFGEGSPATFMSFPFSFGFPKDTGGMTAEFDAAKAADLLETAGYAEGFELTLFAATEGRDFAQAISQYLGEVGIKVDLQVREISQVLAEMRSDEGKSRTRLALVFGATGSGARADVGGLLYTYLNPGESYAQPYEDPDFSDMIKAQSVETDPDARGKMLADILQHNFEENYIMPLYYANALFAVGGRVKSWSPIPGVGYPSNLNQAVLAD